MSRKNLKGELSIGRPHTSDGSKYIEIEINDKISGTECVSLRVSLDNFAEALTGLSRVDCEFDFRPEMVGKRREHKEETVPFKGGFESDPAKRKTQAAKALAPFEKDGWSGYAEDLFNHHRGGQGKYRVRFVRYVDEIKEID